MARQKLAPLNLADFDLSPERGFLPRRNPLPKLAKSWSGALDQMVSELPKLLVAGQLRSFINNHRGALLDESVPLSLEEAQCAGRVLSFAGHAYVWEDPEEPADHLPAALAVPWCRMAKQLGRPPVLSYASYALDNWRRLDPAKPIALGNIVLLQNFFGGLDEEWFVLVHVDIEAKAGPALAGIVQATQAVLADSPDAVTQSLSAIAAAEEQMCRTLLRMPEGCDPYIYYNRVRPYLHGWKDHPALPHGLVYEGVEEFQGRPQQFRGETGAQSSIIHALDAALGVLHSDDPLEHYLSEMRAYMPPNHRAFIDALEHLQDERGRPLLYGYVRDRKDSHPKLWTAFADCIQWLARFRETHLEYADRYIQQQSPRSTNNPTAVGTGGTPFMAYLKKHLDETERLTQE